MILTFVLHLLGAAQLDFSSPNGDYKIFYAKVNVAEASAHCKLLGDNYRLAEFFSAQALNAVRRVFSVHKQLML